MTLPTRWYRYHESRQRSTVFRPAVLAFDVGGSHVSSAICFFPAFALRSANRIELPSQLDASQFVELLAGSNSQDAGDGYRVAGAVVAIGAPFDYVRGISQMRHKFSSLYGFDLKAALAERLACSPHEVLFLNDGDAFLLGEIGAGAAKGVHKAVGITLGTGIGSAFAIDGELVLEGAGIPLDGEVWNLPYGAGIVEDFLSTRAIQEPYWQRRGRLSEVAEIAASAVEDSAAAEVFVNFGEHLGLILRYILADFSPEVVVIGGGIARSAHLFLPSAIAQLRSAGIRLQVSSLLDHAALVGAGLHWFTRSGYLATNEVHDRETR